MPYVNARLPGHPNNVTDGSGVTSHSYRKCSSRGGLSGKDLLGWRGRFFPAEGHPLTQLLHRKRQQWRKPRQPAFGGASLDRFELYHHGRSNSPLKGLFQPAATSRSHLRRRVSFWLLFHANNAKIYQNSASYPDFETHRKNRWE